MITVPLNLFGSISVKWWKLWLLFFLYTVISAALVQLFIVYILPQFNLGHGLFVPDSTGFHQIAVNVSALINKKGWSAWELRPGGQYPAGIASVFYYIFWPKPFVLIPFNAILHATAGILIYYLLETFLENQKVSLVGSTLFIVNPATLEWTAQIHKDGTFIVGNLLIITAWIILVKTVKKNQYRLRFILSPLLTILGSVFIWASRPYWNQVSITASIILLIPVLIIWIIEIIKEKSFRLNIYLGLVVALVVIAIQFPFVNMHYSLVKEAEFIRSEHLSSSLGKSQAQLEGVKRQLNSQYIENRKSGNDLLASDQDKPDNPKPNSFKIEEQGIEEQGIEEQGEKYEGKTFSEKLISDEVVRTGRPEAFIIKWKHNQFIPDLIESRLYSLSYFRLVTGSQGGKTIIDRDIIFESLNDFFRYLPRAAQIGFLSPFPQYWTGRGSIPVNTIGRLILGFLTAFSYICFIFFFLSVKHYYQKLEFWIIIIFNTFGLLVFTYGYPNVGTLNRMRYGFYMTIVATGFAFLVSKIMKAINHKKKSQFDTKK